MKKQVNSIVERTPDGGYSIYSDDDTLEYLVTGTGETLKDAIECFLGGYSDISVVYAEEGKPFTECEFTFVDVHSTIVECLNG